MWPVSYQYGLRPVVAQYLTSVSSILGCLKPMHIALPARNMRWKAVQTYIMWFLMQLLYTVLLLEVVSQILKMTGICHLHAGHILSRIYNCTKLGNRRIDSAATAQFTLHISIWQLHNLWSTARENMPWLHDWTQLWLQADEAFELAYRYLSKTQCTNPVWKRGLRLTNFIVILMPT